jgi:hypothetical protein
MVPVNSSMSNIAEGVYMYHLHSRGYNVVKSFVEVVLALMPNLAL